MSKKLANAILLFRESNKILHSIENVFNTLLPFLTVDKMELPFESKRIRNRIKNIQFLRKNKTENIHYNTSNLK